MTQVWCAVRNIVNLANSGVLDPRVALQSLSFIPNVDDYMVGMKDWNEYVDKRKENTQNKNNSGVNQTNLDRQNKEPLTANQEDNKTNATLGESEKISENKVE